MRHKSCARSDGKTIREMFIAAIEILKRSLNMVDYKLVYRDGQCIAVFMGKLLAIRRTP